MRYFLGVIPPLRADPGPLIPLGSTSGCAAPPAQPEAAARGQVVYACVSQRHLVKPICPAGYNEIKGLLTPAGHQSCQLYLRV